MVQDDLLLWARYCSDGTRPRPYTNVRSNSNRLREGADAGLSSSAFDHLSARTLVLILDPRQSGVKQFGSSLVSIQLTGEEAQFRFTAEHAEGM